MTRSFLAETNLLVSVIGVCMMIISYFLVRTLRSIDNNQKKLFDKFEAHEQRLSTLEGEHRALTGRNFHE